MPCDPQELKHVPLFALLDDEELAVLAAQVDLRKFAPRQRIYKIGDPGKHAYIFISGSVQVTTVDEDNQEVVVDEPGHGEFFGFASMLDQTPHQTNALAIEETECVEISRDDIATLLSKKPMAGMDMLTVLGRQFHASQQLVRVRANRNPNEVIEERKPSASASPTPSPASAARGPSSSHFAIVLTIYTSINVVLEGKAWDPYPFILLNLFLSMLAAIQAPVIMMSQNRQDKKDRLRSELDFDVNRRAESEIQHLARKLNLVQDKIGDLDDLLRERMPSASPQSACGPGSPRQSETPSPVRAPSTGANHCRASSADLDHLLGFR